MLLHPQYSPKEHTWYIEPQKQYAHYLTNQDLLSKRGYPPTRAAQWLYDRPQAIFQLFIMSGEQQWLTKGKEMSSFYQQHIDEKGLFTLKNRFDAKYLMPKGLLYDFFSQETAKLRVHLKRFIKPL